MAKITFLCIKYRKPTATRLILRRILWGIFYISSQNTLNLKMPHLFFERGKMLNWVKRLFKKEKRFGFMDVEIEIKEVKSNYRYNIRDKKGRFTKKGKSNGKRR